MTYRYITDAELSYVTMIYSLLTHFVQPGDVEGDEAKILQQVISILSMMPLDYHMKNLWNPADSNEELSKKFKSTISEYL